MQLKTIDENSEIDTLPPLSISRKSNISFMSFMKIYYTLSFVTWIVDLINSLNSFSEMKFEVV